MTVDGADTRPGATRIGRAARYGLLIGPSLSMLDSSIVNVAVPDIAQDLRAGLDTVHWVVSGYLLSLAVGLALTAYASRRFGTMRIYLVSMALFVATSAVCALAPSIELLVTARVVQGFVGAPLVPLALSILMGKDGLSGGKVPVSAAVVLFLAPALGPSLGGLLIGAGGWRWVFLVNVPVGAAGLLLALRLRRLGTRARADSRFDPIGFLLLSAGLVTTLLGATRGSASGWGNPAPLALVVAGIGLLAAYVRTSSRRKDPPVRLDVIRSSQSLLALILQVLASVIAFGTVFLIPVFTQQVQGHTALATGLALIPQGVVMGLGTALGQRISTHIPLRTLVTLGFAALAVSSGVMLLLTNDTPLWVTAIMLCGRALAAGFVTTPLLAAFLAPLGEDELADGNTLYNITQRLGGAVGVGILGSMVATGADSGAALAAFHQVGAVLVALALAAGVLARSLSRA